MSPGGRRVRDHGVGSRIKLVVLNVQLHSLLPVVMPLAGPADLRDVQLGTVHLDEVHELLWLVLGVQHTQLSVHSDVGPLVAQAVLQQHHQFLEMSVLFVVHNELLQVIRVDNNVHTGHLGHAELVGGYTCGVHLLPSLRVVGLLRGVNSKLKLSQLNEARRKPSIVGDGLEQDLSCLEETLVVEAVPNALHIRGVGAANKLFHLRERVSLGQSIHQLRVDVLVLL
mmetsp:Transcript_33252/g.72654  ORF Transcript_33252/g.72654 Transcript_33252/m.72654 type:complete len:226 (-) Transcript_33252:2344-3021(-)